MPAHAVGAILGGAEFAAVVGGVGEVCGGEVAEVGH